MSPPAVTEKPLNCPDCGTEIVPVRGRRQGKRRAWCSKCERALRPGEIWQARKDRINRDAGV